MFHKRLLKVKIFQSTLPVWGATLVKTLKILRRAISIHAPRVGSDREAKLDEQLSNIFQSTLPVWGATRLSLELGRVHFISIHAPRVGSDCRST